jgi:hypothetical protein
MSLSEALMRVLLTIVLTFIIVPVGFAEEVTIGGERLSVERLYEEDFEGVVNRWRFDGRGRVWVEDGRLQMDATAVESTAWFTEEMEGDLLITYQAHILDPVERNNINLFFLGTASDGGDVLKVYLTGSYPEYHKLPNYIWTFTWGHTRLRRDPGFQLLSEDKKTLPEPYTTYKLAVMIQRGLIRCFVNGRLIHSYQDPNPHRKGKLGFRTFHTRLWWDNLRVYRILKAAESSRGR